MEQQTEAQARALEPTLGNAASPTSRRAVAQLARLQPELKVNRLACYACWDLGNLVRCALAAGAPADARWGEQDAPVLCLAAQEGAARSLKALLTGGADVRLADKNGGTALYWAASNGEAACIALLLEAGAPLEVKAVRYFRSRRRFAAALTPGAALDNQSDSQTLLSVAASGGHVDAVAALLQRGADANQVDKIGSTAIMSAVVGQHTRCVELLLPHSNLSITNRQGHTVFHACVMTASYGCFKLLLPLVADMDVRTVPGVNAAGTPQPFNVTAAHIACDRGQHKMLEKLLRRGASRTARDSRQATPLHCAAMAGQLSCVVQLIGHPEAYKMSPSDINAADENGMTPLHWAAAFGRAKCCGLLIAAGARLGARDRDGDTPLIVAQQEYPANTALLDLLAGRGPEHLPGTTCDRCGCPEDPASHLMPCSGCQVARYCSIACQHAAWEAHEPECGRLKAEREHRTRINDV